MKKKSKMKIADCVKNGGKDVATLKENKDEFYVKVKKSACKEGIAKVIITAQLDYEGKATKITYGHPEYSCTTGGQPVISNWEYKIEEKDITSGKEGKIKKSISWNNLPGILKIHKTDEVDSTKSFPGVKFVIKDENDKYFRSGAFVGDTPVYDKEVNGKEELELAGFIGSSQDEATIYTTDSNGDIELINWRFPKKKIRIIEIYNPYYGYKSNENKEWVAPKVRTGKPVTVEISNKSYLGNLSIKKVDTDSGKPLSGVKFKLKKSSGEYVQAYGNEVIQLNVTGTITLTNMTTTAYESLATEFITDSNGMVTINNLLADENIITDVNGNETSRTSTYTIVETSIGNNEQYEIDDSYITWESTSGSGTTRNASVIVQTGQTFNITYKNRKKYIDLSGLVWEDISDSKTGDAKDRDGLYNQNGNDKLIKNISVQLRKINADEIVGTCVTDVNGKYLFKKVKIDDLPNLYIKFEYNGLDYENVECKKDLANGSKATEGTAERTKLNETFSTITYENNNGKIQGIAKSTSAQKTAIEYFEGDNESTLNYEIKGLKTKQDVENLQDIRNESTGVITYNKSDIYGYASNTLPINNVAEKYRISANTNDKYALGGGLDKYKTPDEIRKSGISEVTDINLGIQKRKQVDLKAFTDLESIKVHINNSDHIYKYSDRLKKALKEDPERYMEPQVKFGKFSNMSYTRALYASDIKYKGKKPDKSDELEVRATYSIKVNNTSSLKATINEITDYYDSKFEFINVGTEIDDSGSIKKGSELTRTNENTNIAGKYNRLLINKIDIDSGKTKDIYLELRVKKDEIVKILDNKEDICEVDNIVEITSYSMKDVNSNQPYAAIDINSQPGNAKITKENTIDKTYENDTDKAPGLKVVLQEARQISGKVFIDKANSSNGKDVTAIMTGEVRQGNGSFDNDETGVQGIDVKLMKIEGETSSTQAKYYDWKQGQQGEWKDAKTTTDENGDFTISGFIPDNYQIVYTWGGQTYTLNGTNEKIRVQDYKSTTVDKNSYQLKGDKQGQDIEWYKDEFKKRYQGIEWNNGTQKEIRVSDALDDYDTRKDIDEQTSIITNENKKVIENYEGKVKVNDKDEDLIISMDSTTPTFRVNVEYNTSETNSDEEYAKNANGELITNGIYVEKAEGHKNHLKSIDFGIIERAKQALELTKNITNAKVMLPNASILIDATVKEDRKGFVNDVNYAKYLPISESTPSGELYFEIDNELLEGSQLEVHYNLQVNNISELDYLTEDFYFYGRKAESGDLVTLNAKEVIDYLDNEISTMKPEDFNEIGQVLQSNQLLDLVNKGLLEDSSEMKKLLGSINGLKIDEKLSKELSPGNNSTINAEIVTSKLLSDISSTTEVEISNSAEIIKIEKNGGSTLEQIPGNSMPNSTSKKEIDDDVAETVVIVPPTGENNNYTLFIIIAVVSLGVLSVGIIFIKMFLNNLEKNGKT